MRAQRDWVMTVSDHGNGQMLVEVRDEGRLALRRMLTADAIACEGALELIVSEAQRQCWERKVGARR